MADKKTTKAEMKKTELSLPEQLAEKRRELIEAKRGHSAGELQNPRALGKIRKDIARLMTEINAKKKGNE
ncbi:MAG: 50S ribosomal protein L29 [Candidatus Nomurabacteria bacterium]|jgi:ribosomal protein L29|nr:50S ribosomal protein L29 [Candidatus Nomurabacteria bacterium]